MATRSERITPQDLDAERCALGAMLLRSEAVSRGVELLTAGDFYLEAHQSIFTAIRSLAAEGKPVDMVSVAAELDPKLEACGGAAYLSNLIDAVPAPVNIGQYCEIVREHSIRRGVIIACDRMTGNAYNRETPARELVDAASGEMFALGARFDTRECRTVDDEITEFLERLDGNQPEHHISTGFRDLDRMITGFYDGDLVVIAGRPGMGKTALALSIVEQVVLMQGQGALLFSLEMPSRQLFSRLLACRTRVGIQDIRRNTLTEWQIEQLVNVAGEYHHHPLFIDDTSGISTLEITAKARRVKAKHPEVAMIVVDYLQLVRGPKSENRVQEISAISRALKNLGRELQVPVIALSQLSRDVEKRHDRRPVLSDLRDGGSIEAEADLVMFLYRASYYDAAATPDSDEIELLVRKHRNGPTGDLKLTFWPRCNRFADYSDLEEA